jgi:radical SAM superfamily enzyme YgiQ (UPF0313 family)
VFKDEENNVFKTPRRSLIADLDQIPMPARELLPMHKYGGSVARSASIHSHSMMTSRGCHGCCTFCHHKTFGNQVRYFSSERVVDEFFLLRDKYGADDIQIMDDNFVTNHDFVEKICQSLKRYNFGKTFSIEARADAVNPIILKTLKNAGCDYIAFGVESGSQRILNYIQKRETLLQIRQAIVWAKEAGLKIRGYFILGFPTETRDEMMSTINFAKELNIEVASFTLFIPFPGSVDWNRSQIQGIFDPEYYKKYILTEFNFPSKPVYVPEGMTAKELLDIHRYAYNNYYFRPKFILKRLMAVRNVSEVMGLMKGCYTLLSNFFSN